MESGYYGEVSIWEYLRSANGKFSPSSEWISKSGGKKSDGAKPVLRISVPKFDNSECIAKYAKTLIGRCMNPQKQDMKILLFVFPRIWNLEGRVTGLDLGMGRFQFDFLEEKDFDEVMKMEPFHFDYWMVSLVRWKPVLEPLYPSKITLWVRVMDIPLQFWDDQTFRSIGEALGNILEPVDLAEGRVRVELDGFQPLIFSMAVGFEEGVEIMVSLRYEKLFGFCRECSKMTHDQTRCPNLSKEMALGDTKGISGDRAQVASYKAFVENTSYEEAGREEGHSNKLQMVREGQKDKDKGIAYDRKGHFRQDVPYHPYKGKTTRDMRDGPLGFGRNKGRGARGLDYKFRGNHFPPNEERNLPSGNTSKLMGDAFKGVDMPSHGAGSNSKVKKALFVDEGSSGETPIGNGGSEIVPGQIILGKFDGASKKSAEGDVEETQDEHAMNSNALDDANLMIDGVLLSDSELLLEDGEDMEGWEQGEIPDFPEAMEDETLETKASEVEIEQSNATDEEIVIPPEVKKDDNATEKNKEDNAGVTAHGGAHKKRHAQVLLSPRKQLLAKAMAKVGGKGVKKAPPKARNPTE